MTRNINSDPNLIWYIVTKYIKIVAKKEQNYQEKKLCGGTRKFKLSSTLKRQTTKPRNTKKL